MLDVAGYGPAITWPGVDGTTADAETEVTAHQVPGLFCWVRVSRQRAAFAHAKFSQQGAVTVDQRLALNPRQGRPEPA